MSPLLACHLPPCFRAAASVNMHRASQLPVCAWARGPSSHTSLSLSQWHSSPTAPDILSSEIDSSCPGTRTQLALNFFWVISASSCWLLDTSCLVLLCLLFLFYPSFTLHLPVAGLSVAFSYLCAIILCSYSVLYCLLLLTPFWSPPFPGKFLLLLSCHMSPITFSVFSDCSLIVYV